MKSDGGPAYPMPMAETNDGTWCGMTLRDYHAAHAPNMPVGSPVMGETDYLERVVKWRYLYADAMLESWRR